MTAQPTANATPANDLTDHHVVITGGSQGIGLAVARELTHRCRSLTLLARDPQRLSHAAAELHCHWMATDVRDLSAEAKNTLAQATLLIACAGEMTPGRIIDLTDIDYQRQIDTNFIGTVNSVRAALPHMVQRGGGTIVLISSTAALLGIYGYSAYGATKAAVAYFAETLRAETTGTGVRVIVAYPPDTETPGLQRERLLRPPQTNQIVGRITAQPAQRIAERLVAGISRGNSRITFDATTAALLGYTSLIDRAFQLYCSRVLRTTPSHPPIPLPLSGIQPHDEERLR